MFEKAELVTGVEVKEVHGVSKTKLVEDKLEPNKNALCKFFCLTALSSLRPR